MVPDRPYVDRPMGDDAAADRAAARAVDAWGLDRAVLMRRGMNALYVCGEVVLRIGHTTAPAHLAHDLVEVMRSHGVYTVAPVIGLAADFDGLTVTAWERVVVVDEAIDWAAVGDAVRHVHDVGDGEVPAGYPAPSPTSFPWWDFDSLLGEVADLLDGSARRGLEAAIARHDGWHDEVAVDPVICHGDVHPGNVLMSTNGPMLIDWDLLCTANRAWDHAMLTTYATRWGGDPGAYPAFADGYGADMADDEITTSLAELRNVAATLMRVRAGRVNGAARDEAERRLRYWRGDRDAPTWSAQ
jgi:hypothetical protein